MNKAMTEIRGQDVSALKATLDALRQEKIKLRFHAADEGVTASCRNREIRREVARILTVIGEHERAEGNKS